MPDTDPRTRQSDSDSDALGDAIGHAVIYAIRDAEWDAGSLCICDPFGGSDPQSCPNCYDGTVSDDDPLADTRY